MTVSVYSGFTHYQPNQEATHMSINWWMDKQIAPYPYNSPTLSNNKKKQTTDKQQHGWIANALRQLKDARLKRLHTMWFYLYDILEKAKW